DSTQPEPSHADSRITSTPSSTNEVKASIWDFWSRLVAGAYFRVKPASSVKVSWMFSSLAWRQAPSGPTATKPIVIGSPESPPPEPPAASVEQAARTVPTRPAAPRPRRVRRVGVMISSLRSRGAGSACPGSAGPRAGMEGAAGRRAMFQKCYREHHGLQGSSHYETDTVRDGASGVADVAQP